VVGVKGIEAGIEFWWEKLSRPLNRQKEDRKIKLMIQVNFVCEGYKWMKLAQYSIQDQALCISGVVIFLIFCINIRISVTYS
jgi:hypothetical protein